MILLAVIIPALTGYLLLNLLLRNRPALLTLPEKIALGYLAGTSLITLQMFVYALLKIEYSALAIALPWLLLLPALAVKSSHKPLNLKAIGRLDRVLAAAIGLKLIYVFYEALIKPIVTWDAIWNFAIRAKIFYFLKTIPLDKTSPFFMGLGMHQYPIQVPLLETWGYFMMGRWDDISVKIFFPLYFCALLVVFYSVVRRYQPRTSSLFYTFLLSSLPLLTYHAATGYADFVVGVYFFAAVAYLYRYMMEKERSLLFLSAALIGLAGWVKDEGVIFYFICIFILVLYEKFKGWKNIPAYLVPLGLYTLPWLIFKKLHGLEVGNRTRWQIGEAFGSFLRPDVLAKIAEKTFLTDNWHLLPVAFIVFLVFYCKEVFFTARKYILLAFGLAWAFFMALYVFTNNWTMVLTDIILSRNYLTYLPLALFLIAVTVDLKLKKTSPD